MGWGQGGGGRDEEDRINPFGALTTWYEIIYIYIFLIGSLYIPHIIPHFLKGPLHISPILENGPRHENGPGSAAHQRAAHHHRVYIQFAQVSYRD